MNTEVAARQNESHREFLTFKLATEDYAAPILQVQEIRGIDSITRLPEAPPQVKGIINLRGTIVPIVDLRTLLRIDATSGDDNPVMVIVNVAERVVGMIVDSVSDVVAVGHQQIAPPPDLGAMAARRFVSGLATLEQRLIILVDLERLLSMTGEDLDAASNRPERMAA